MNKLQRIITPSVDTCTIKLYPWNISIIGKCVQGERNKMEDFILFEKPFIKHDTCYCQCMVIDGHSIHPFEVYEFMEECKQYLKIPIKTTLIPNWQKLINTFEHKWSDCGGVVFHIISIQFPKEDPRSFSIYRLQVGDCNSVLFDSNETKMNQMYVHNTTQREERDRVLPWLHNERVGGVLQCTRVLGNTELKKDLTNGNGAPDNLLFPTILYKRNHFTIESGDWLGIIGSDGCMSNQDRMNMIINILQKKMSEKVDLNSMIDMGIQMSDSSDNIGMIMIRFEWIGI